jgi:hypothetical protein
VVDADWTTDPRGLFDSVIAGDGWISHLELVHDEEPEGPPEFLRRANSASPECDSAEALGRMGSPSCKAESGVSEVQLTPPRPAGSRTTCRTVDETPGTYRIIACLAVLRVASSRE